MIVAIDAMDAAGKVPVVMNMPATDVYQTTPAGDVTQDVIDGKNLIKAYCLTAGYKFIDLWELTDAGDGTLKPEYDLGDGIHMNSAGCTALANLVAAQLALPDSAATTANQVIRDRPNRELMTVADMYSVYTLVNDMGDGWDTVQYAFWFNQDDLSASGNVVTDLKAAQTGALTGGFKAFAGVEFAVGEYFDTGGVTQDDIFSAINAASFT